MVINECEICEDFKNGELNKLYSRFYSPLVFFARKFLTTTEIFLAEDVVQNAILEAWKMKEKFNNDNALKSFLYVTVKNNAISIIRKNSSKIKYLSTIENFDETMYSMIEEETFIQLMIAIDELPDNYKKIFNFIYFEKLNMKEVAEKMKLSEISIKKYKAKGVTLLKKRLKSKELINLLLIITN